MGSTPPLPTDYDDHVSLRVSGDSRGEQALLIILDLLWINIASDYESGDQRSPPKIPRHCRTAL
jgi:hypothetical protein